MTRPPIRQMSEPGTAPDPAAARLWSLPAWTLVAAAAIVPLVMYPWAPEVFGRPKLWVLWSGYALTMLLVAAAIGRGSLRPMRWIPWLDGAVAVFGLAVMASFIFSPHRSQSLWGESSQYQGLLTLVLYFGYFYWARLTLDTEVWLRRLIQAAGFAGTLVAGYALLQRLGMDPIWSDLPNGRVFSTIGQPNALGSYLAATSMLSVALAFGAVTRRARFAWALAALAQLAALILTISRGSYLALAVALVVFVGAAGRSIWKSVRPGAALVGALALGLALAVVATVGPARDTAERIVRRTVASVDTGVPGSVRMHLDLWKVAWEISLDHPWVGTGPDTYALVFPEYRDEVLPSVQAAAFRPFRVESPHNVYLAHAVGSGLIALFAYVGIIVVALLLVARGRSRGDPTSRLLASGVLAAAAAHLVGDAFITADVTGTWFFWVLLGAAVAAFRQRTPAEHG